MVQLLNDVFSWFDQMAESYGLEKIKTIGDAYMVAGGLLENDSQYTAAIANMALEVREQIGSRTTPNGEPLSVHIGIGTGPVVAGVIGVKKFIYDLWGNSVNFASGLATEAGKDGILVDSTTYRRLHNQYEFKGPQPVVVKRQQDQISYLLLSKLAHRGGARIRAA